MVSASPPASTRRRGSSRILFCLLAGLLLVTAGEGPDFGSYTDWAAAALTGDIFSLRGNVLSPGGVPFTIAAAGPGLLFAIGKVVLLPLSLATAAVAAGWVAAIVFWSCAFIVLRRVADGRDDLAWLGAGALFIGTHAGLYSHSYATEVFANALIAALWAIALTRQRWRWIESAIVGALAGILLLVRAHVVLYAIPALWVACVESAGASIDGHTQAHNATFRVRVAGSIAAIIPLAIAAAEYAMVNRWMTGAWLHPPYLYGDAGFTAVDLWHPEFAAVLLHPWHGLLAYHPLYGIAFVAVAIQAWRTRSVLWRVTLLAAILHLWVQAGWYIWWLGGTTFGMRGLAPAALPLVAGLIAVIRRDLGTRPRRAVVWIGAVALACVWSYPLLLRGNTQFRSWTDLLSAQHSAVIAMAVVGVILVGALRWRSAGVMRPNASPELRSDSRSRIAIYGSTIAFAAAGVIYLIVAAVPLPNLETRSVAGGLVAGAIALWFVFAREVGARAAYSLAGIAVLLLFVAQAGLFARLAIRTEHHRASGAEPPRAFAYISASPVDELRVTYAEYLDVPGFERQKTSFRRFLQSQRIAASRLAPEDRRIADAVTQLLNRDPQLRDVLIEPIARDGIVEIRSPGITDQQASRIRELALRIPGARGITFMP